MMTYQSNPRWGFTQETENKKGHFQGILSEMTPNRMTDRGFTLIELLVVVLIIGILAAVALPQYQKAVKKARLQEAVLLVTETQKGMDLYLLEHSAAELDREEGLCGRGLSLPIANTQRLGSTLK